MKRRPVEVRVTAMGAVSGFGVGVEALWSGLLSGASRIERSPFFCCETAPVSRVPDDAVLPAEGGASPGAAIRGPDWSDRLLRAAARQIQASPAWARLSRLSPARLGVCVGTTQGPVDRWLDQQRRLGANPACPADAAPLATPVVGLARALGARGPVACPSMACASGTAAIGLGLEWIRADLCDAVVAGGFDALSELVYHGFANLRALDPERPRPFDAERAGLCVGEGAGLVLLEADATPDAGPILCGQGHSADANHLTGPDPTGAGVARAVTAAFAEAGLKPEQIDFVSAHGTATVFNDLMEAKALATVFGARAAREIPVHSIKGAVGHTMGAAGALEAVVCARILATGLAPPTAGLRNLDPRIGLRVVAGEPLAGSFRRVLSTSSGFGGVNAALVLAV